MTIAGKRTAILAVVVIALGGAALADGCLEPTRAPRPVTIGVAVQPMSAPIYVAQEKGFFEKEGLQVTIQPYSAGADAMHAAISGRADFATTADIPVMFAGLKGERVLVVATIGTSQNYVRIVARRDHGIARPGDLKGRTVAVRSGTSSEYFIHVFLTFNGMSEQDVRIVDMQLPRMAQALAKGEIDAAASWSPYTGLQQKALGGKAVTFSNRFVYELDWNMVANPDVVKRDPETVERLLKALVRATGFIESNPEEAQEITARWIGWEGVSFTESRFDVHLEQSLLINLETQARWAIRSGRLARRKVPNYLPMISAKALLKVRPEAVTIVHE